MENKEKQIILADEGIRYGGMCLRYQLVDTGEIAERFHVIAVNGEERAEFPVGNDICFASDCYRAVRDGGVTPCTLGDVIADLRSVSVNFGKTLYK